METIENEILTADEVATWLKLSKRSIVDLARRGELPARKVGKEWRFSRSALEQFLVEQEKPGESKFGTDVSTGQVMAVPGPLDRAGGFALVGDPESGRTNALLHFLLRDCRDDNVAVALFERAEGLLADAVNDLDEPDFISSTTSSGGITKGLEIRHQLAVRTDDKVKRKKLLECVIDFAKSHPSDGPISLIVDDADQLVPELAKMLADRPTNLWPTIVWQVTGSKADKVLLGHLEGLMIFRVNDMKAAVFVADMANDRIE